MALAIGIGIVVGVLAIILFTASSEDELSDDLQVDPTDAFLRAMDRGEELGVATRQRLLTLGTRVVGPLFGRLLGLEAEFLEPDAQLAIEETIADFGVAGVNALVPDLVLLHRRHPAVPATVRIVERVGLPILPKLSRERRVPLELRVLILRRFVGRGERVWESATRGDDSAFFVAAEVRRRFELATLPLDLLRACAELPGERTAALDAILDVGSASDFPLDRFDRGERNAADDLHCLLSDELRQSAPARARGWGAEDQPSRRGSLKWLRWAAPRIDEVPVREALLEVARRRAGNAFFALAAVGKRDSRLVVEMLRSSRAHGWQKHHGDWLRAALRFGGFEAEHVALERLVRGPLAEEALMGSAFAELDVGQHLESLLAGFYRVSGRAAVEIEGLIGSGGTAVRDEVVKYFVSEDRRPRRAAFELAGRLGWPVASAVLAGAITNPLDSPFVIPSFELLNEAVAREQSDEANLEVRRACTLVARMAQPS